ncbi:hypothetical protein GOODEAATRI_005209 [Goodea atripinnis]|uniref:Uncharacterized protein n=1 Tax=Goodea atripinnis TaxID=208336 RepID=A0ABV0PL39_9TELE
MLASDIRTCILNGAWLSLSRFSCCRLIALFTKYMSMIFVRLKEDPLLQRREIAGSLFAVVVAFTGSILMNAPYSAGASAYLQVNKLRVH